MIVMGEKTHDIGNDNSLQMLGVGLLQLDSSSSSNNSVNVIFQKGIGMPIIQNMLELYKHEIIKKKKGNSIIPLDQFTIFLHFFEVQPDSIYIMIYMDKKETEINYTKLYLLTKRINNLVQSQEDFGKIVEFCDHEVQIPQTDGLIAVFIIGSTGSPYFSKIDKNRASIAKSEVHIGGFISALYSFSKEIIGQESGASLKEINFGNQRFYMIVKNDTIFAYLVEDLSPLLERYMYLIVDDFLEEFKSYLADYQCDITPFNKFNETFNRYFII